jgi:hypothetical protein
VVVAGIIGPGGIMGGGSGCEDCKGSLSMLGGARVGWLPVALGSGVFGGGVDPPIFGPGVGGGVRVGEGVGFWTGFVALLAGLLAFGPSAVEGGVVGGGGEERVGGIIPPRFRG